MRTWVEEYVKGCAQMPTEQKSDAQTQDPPLPHPVPPEAKPFEVVAMDLITQLPKVGTRRDPDDRGPWVLASSSLVPCSTAISGEGVARLYLTHVYQWFGLPSKIISDRDPASCQNSQKPFANNCKSNKHLYCLPPTNRWAIGTKEPMGRTIPQTRGQREARRLERNGLPLATAVHNARINATTKVTPFQTLLGYNPNLKGSRHSIYQSASSGPTTRSESFRGASTRRASIRRHKQFQNNNTP